MKKIKQSDLFDLDDTLAKIILPYIEAFRKIKRTGCPIEFFTSDKKGGHCKNWNKALDKMIFAMRAIIDSDKYYSSHFTKKNKLRVKEYNEHNKKVQEGLELFGKFFLALWD